MHPETPYRGSSTQQGYGVEHRALRKRVLIEEPYCVGFPPGIHGALQVPTTVMDHIVSQRRGGLTIRSNARGLCLSCNSRKAVVVEGARPR